MAKKKKKIQETTIENFYDLKVDKVDELVAALKDGTIDAEEEVNFGIAHNTGVDDPKNYTRRGKEKQFNPYKTDFLGKVPTWIKAFFVKWWFAGMVCLFFMFGINLQDVDAILLIGLVLGIVVDILVNPLFRYFQSDRNEYDAYMMFPFSFKAIWTFFANIFYYLIVVYVVNLGYFGLNELINIIKGTQNLYYVGVEPLLFGVLAFIVDMAFIGIKDGIVALIRHIRKRKKEEALNV